MLNLKLKCLYKVSTKCGRDIGILEFVETKTLDNSNFIQYTFNVLAWHSVMSKPIITFQEMKGVGSAKNHIFIPITIQNAELLTSPKKRLKRLQYFEEYRKSHG